MATINLLPWRIERRIQREKAFYRTLVLVVITTMLLALCVWLYYSSQIKTQNVRNAFLQTQLSQADVQVKQVASLAQKKHRLLERLNQIDKVLARRAQIAHLFDALARAIPDGVMLFSVKQTGNVLTLRGWSQSNAIVSTYMRGLEGTGWITKPELSTIETNPERTNRANEDAGDSHLPYVFTLTVELGNPTNIGQRRVMHSSLSRIAANSAERNREEPQPELGQ